MTSALVIGGGIAGCAIAAGLAQKGWRVRVTERAPVLRTEGAGLQITPNGFAALRVLNCCEAVARASLPAQTLTPTNGLNGSALMHVPLDHADYRTIFRASLQQALAQCAEMHGATFDLDQRLCDVHNAEGGTELLFASGEQISLSAYDVVVSADGGLSLVRTWLNGEDDTEFSGQVAWRCVVPRKGETGVCLSMAPGQHVVSYPLDEASLNIVAVEEGAGWADDGWHHDAPVEKFRERFAQFAAPVREQIGRAETVMRWGLIRRPVAQSWAKENLVLIGDAAHPTLPFLAQGANLALEDAALLTRVLEHGAGGLPEKLLQFQALRKPRVTKAVAKAAANARNYHLSGLERRAAHTVLRGIGALAPAQFLKRFDWLYGYDVGEVNLR